MERERAEGLLEERARLLARPAERGEEGDLDLEVVTFRRGDEIYGIGASWVGEVVTPLSITPVPCTPAFVDGIINIRGRVVSVLDLFSEGAQAEPAEPPQVVVLVGHDMEFGVRVDEVGPTRHLSRASLLPVPAALAAASRHGALGLTPDGAVILEGGGLLSDASLVVREHVRPSAREV